MHRMFGRTVALVILAAAVVAMAIGVAPERSLAGAAADCTPERTHASGDFDETIDSGGLTREYILHIPPSYTGGTALPLVLNLHGLGGNAAQQSNYTGLSAKGDAEGFITVAPQGTSGGAFALPHWNNNLFEQVDDLGFIGDLLDKLEADLCVDATRVYSTGLSNGAMMSVRLACNLSERITAVALVAGSYYPPFAVELVAEPDCAGPRPVPVIAFHGTADPVILYEGGPVGLAGGVVSTRHIEDEVIPDWAAHNGCDPAPVESEVTTNVRLLEYSNCDDGVAVQLYSVDGGGHSWPDAAGFLPESIVGPTTTEINANDLLWAFFQSYALPAAPAPAPSPTDTPAATVAALPTTGGDDGDGRTSLALWIGITAAIVVVVGGGAFGAWRLLGRRHTPA